MAVSVELPKEYGYVVLAVVAYAFLNFWMSFQVQGVLPHHVRQRVGEQGCQALQLRPEGAPELDRDDAALLRHAAGRRPAAPRRRRRAGAPLHRRQVLLLQGLCHRRPGKPPQAWESQLPGDIRTDHLHGVVRHQPCHQGGHLRSTTRHGHRWCAQNMYLARKAGNSCF